MAHIEDREMILRYHQFSTEDIRAIAKSLSVRQRREKFRRSLIEILFLVLVQSEY